MQENLLEQLQKLLSHKKSNAFYASRLGISEEEVRSLKEELKEDKWIDSFISPEAETGNYIADLEEEYTRLIEQETDHITGNQILTAQSSNPLSPKEIEELASVDNINTYVARSWLKSHKNNTWTYSIDVRYRNKDFYSSEEFEEKIKALLPNYTPAKMLKPEKVQDKALFIYISDDHCGAVNDDSIFQNEYTEHTYTARLIRLSQEIINLKQTFEKVYVISLGDQLNGWNSQTTRGGHEVKSESNKRQFDIYITARSFFYNELFKSGVSEEYIIFNIENSNHCGLGFSYMANKALEFYINGKFPEVKTISTSLPIDILEYGDHVFAVLHGKDEKQQKTPFPLNINDRSDVYFYQFFDKKGFSPYTKHLHAIKGDLHNYNVNTGKSCRYMNIPSIMGSNSYSEVNYGDTKPGAVIEIVNKNNPNILTMPIWFQ